MDKPQARFGILEFAEGVLEIRLYLWQRKALLSIAAGYPTTPYY
jgi:branched-subunit amino acid transport protein AzlD